MLNTKIKQSIIHKQLLIIPDHGNGRAQLLLVEEDFCERWSSAQDSGKSEKAIESSLYDLTIFSQTL